MKSITPDGSPQNNTASQDFPGLVVAPGEAGRKLLSFLLLHLENMPGCNASVVQKWIRSGQVRVNSGRGKPFARLEAGDQVRLPPFALPHLARRNPEQAPVRPGLELPAPKQSRPVSACLNNEDSSDAGYDGEREDAAQDSIRSEKPEDFFEDAPVAFENAPAPSVPAATIIAVEDDLLVAHKPAGLAVQPGSAQSDSLSERLAAHFNARGDASFIPAPAHRLDRAASGLLLCGRSQRAQQKLHALFAEGSHGAESAAKSIKRTYLAWVSGEWDLPPGTPLEDYLVKSYDSESRRELMAVSRDSDGSAGAKLARSLGQTLLIERMPAKITRQIYGRAYARGAGPTERSLIKITLLSGRKHQIRVQAASRGHPIIGDPKYGGPFYPRLLLHAYSISLPDGRRFALLPDWPEPWSLSDVNQRDLED